MSEPNLGTAIGIQAFYVISVLLLLSAWVVQFNRLSGKQTEVPPVETGSLVIAGVAIVFIGLESADPVGRWELIDGWMLRLLSMAAMACNALWLIFNGTFQASLLLVIVQLKLKDEHENRDSWDNYTRAKYLFSFLLFACSIVLVIFTIQENQEGFLWVFVLLMAAGVAGSGAATFLGLYRAYDKKLGSREIASNDVRKNARRKIAVSIFEVLGYHLLFVIILLVDVGFGTPTGSNVEDNLTYVLMVYGVANRLFISFEMWFNWYDSDENAYAQKIEERRSHYKIISVERMIDERIKLEQDKQRNGMETILSEDVLKNTVVCFDTEEDADVKVRTRGYTEEYVKQEALRTGKGSRKKAIKDEDIPDVKIKRRRSNDGHLAPN